MSIKAPIGRVKRNLIRLDFNTGDSIIPMEFYIHENATTAVLVIGPDPNWSDIPVTKMNGGRNPQSLNKLVTSLLEDLDLASIPCSGFNFTRYHIINNNYDKFIAQASSCLEEMMKKFDIHKSLFVIGYSFGGLIALNLSMRRPEICGFVMIAPPLMYHYDFCSWISSYKTNGMIIYGSYDGLAPKNIIDIYSNFLIKKNINITVVAIEEATHKFVGQQYIELKDHIIDYIQKTVENL